MRLKSQSNSCLCIILTLLSAIDFSVHNNPLPKEVFYLINERRSLSNCCEKFVA